MRAYLFYTTQSGHLDIQRKARDAVAFLRPFYPDLEAFCTKTEEEARVLYKKLAGEDALYIVMGGDGTFSNAVDAVMRLEKKPALAFLNAGTLGDAGATISLPRSFKEQLRVIARGKIGSFDSYRFRSESEERFFFYTASLGTFSELAYSVSRERKRRFGRLSYYILALKDLFRVRSMKAEITLDGHAFSWKGPFLMLLSGPRMGGFAINRGGRGNDGVFEAFFPRSLFLGGLLEFLPLPLLRPLRGREIAFELPKCEAWCLDGEKALGKSVTIECFPNSIRALTR